MGIWAYHHGRYGKAVGYLRLAIAEEPQTASTYGLLGKVLEAEGHYQGARRAFAKAAALEPWQCMGYIGVADDAIKLGDYEGARAALQDALRKSICDRVDIHNRLARLDALEAAHGRVRAGSGGAGI
jgi:Flp pilus assembly protein TadD